MRITQLACLKWQTHTKLTKPATNVVWILTDLSCWCIEGLSRLYWQSKTPSAATGADGAAAARHPTLPTPPPVPAPSSTLYTSLDYICFVNSHRDILINLLFTLDARRKFGQTIRLRKLIMILNVVAKMFSDLTTHWLLTWRFSIGSRYQNAWHLLN